VGASAHNPPALLLVVLGLYFGLLGLLTLLCLERLGLTVVALFSRRSVGVHGPLEGRAPSLLVQLPIYNEALVAERLLRAVAKLRYPGPLSIQVLDDSTDETRGLVQRLADELGFVVVRRPSREGFKAGALAHGLLRSDAELVAIFDADFVPPPDFLERTVPTLVADPKVGLVQARWEHLNRDVRWLTRAQAIFLDGHFAIEHQARHQRGHFFNFNGTAGVWRRQAIVEAGGWRADTLTEDLDLSYRAQLAGWRFVYLDQVTAPAELPESFDAFRAQQARWVRGSVETARLLLPKVWRADLPRSVRADAMIHLCNNFAYLLMAALAVLLPMAVVVRDQLGWRVPGGRELLSALDLGLLGGGTLAVAWFYWAAQARLGRELSPTRALELLFALALGAGLSLANAVEVLRGLTLQRSEFLRTPKRGGAEGGRALAVYRPRRSGWWPAGEAAMALYMTAGAIYAIDAGLYGAVPFLVLYAWGFFTIAFGSAKESYRGELPETSTRAEESMN
jgi:hypothetical protein